MSGNDGTGARLCLCCGTPSAARSIPACWDHWNVLPEDLRSSIVISYGRGRTKAYGDGLMEAVRLWRSTGAWRCRTNKTPPTISHTGPETSAGSHSENRVISLIERRQKFAPRMTTDSHAPAEFTERAIRSRS